MISTQRIQSEFNRIKSLGYVVSDKPYTEKNDGALGNTFESLLGVAENNLRDADFEGWECKSQRKHTKSASSLFTCKPDYPLGGDEYMREKFLPLFPNHDVEFIELPFIPWDGGNNYLFIRKK